MANSVASSLHIGREINWGDTIVDKKVKMQINFNKFHAGPEFLWDNTEPQCIKVLQIDCNKDSFDQTISPLRPQYIAIHGLLALNARPRMTSNVVWDITQYLVIHGPIRPFPSSNLNILSYMGCWGPCTECKANNDFKCSLGYHTRLHHQSQHRQFCFHIDFSCRKICGVKVDENYEIILCLCHMS